MLRELHIANLAIIEKVDISLAGGLNVFTGQTGSGKSLILSALELLLGLQGGGEEAALLVRPGATEARVSGIFEVASPALAGRLAEVLDQPIERGEPILVTRRVAASGRSGATVNGAPVTAGMLRDAGQLLVDIHGQHDQQVLLKPANQLLILDAFADAVEPRRQFAEALHELRERQRRLRELRESEDRRVELLDLYRFQIEEIDKADLHAGEYAEARNRYNVLKNVVQLKAQSVQALEALSEGEDTVLERLAAVVRAVQKLAQTDASLAEPVEALVQAEGLLEDAAGELSRYQDRLDLDPDELGEVERRLDVLNRLIHKYGARAAEPAADPVDAVLAYRRQIGQKAEDLDADTKALGGLDRQIAESLERLGQIGQRLSRQRRQAAKRLQALVEEQFRELEMHGAAFEVRLETRAADDPAVEGSGLDEAEFLVRTNPGQDLLPLRKIASGGEMSRIMLALKTILADKDQTAVLIFDEIDSNVGDRLGATIGRKMRALAHGVRIGRKLAAAPAGDGDAAHQVICVTHLSQIAACADHHLEISKQVVGPASDRRTVAKVRVLEGEDRVRELAAMLAGAGVTAATVEHARQLLQQADK